MDLASLLRARAAACGVARGCASLVEEARESTGSHGKTRRSRAVCSSAAVAVRDESYSEAPEEFTLVGGSDHLLSDGVQLGLLRSCCFTADVILSGRIAVQSERSRRDHLRKRQCGQQALPRLLLAFRDVLAPSSVL